MNRFSVSKRLFARHDSTHIDTELTTMIWKASTHRSGIASVCLASVLLYSGATFADQPHAIEAFTSVKYPFVGATGIGNNSHGLAVIVYEIDGIESMEKDLSIGMPADPEKSKQIALHRIQHMDDQSKTKMQMAAQGLAKAMQYGVDRYPAIVFDGQAVVYGVTDVQIAIAHYRAWRQEGK
ncbi:MAG: TIGR03757 family integrating conjugative element protein [gamma proteobacterium symbiont of Phacoides pectinatus]